METFHKELLVSGGGDTEYKRHYDELLIFTNQSDDGYRSCRF